MTALDRELADRDQFGRFEIDAMLLELADNDGEVDRAVGLLSQREHTQYGAIIHRLRAAGRTERRWHGSIARSPLDESPATVAATRTG